jgi:hypothetical protein
LPAPEIEALVLKGVQRSRIIWDTVYIVMPMVIGRQGVSFDLGQLYLNGVRPDDDARHMALDQIAVIAAVRLVVLAPRFQMLADSLDHPAFDLGSRHPRDAAGLILTLLNNRLRDVIAVSRPELDRMTWAHPVAAVIVDATDQKGGARS